jgi:hypothetical protein
MILNDQEIFGKPDAWKLARPVWGWGQGAIPRPTPPGQCTLSTLQTRGGLGEGVGNHVTVSSELFPEFELDGTVMEIGQDEMSLQYLLRNLQGVYFGYQ